jgi:protein involved in temperature-dependent protein secretion
MKPEPDLQKLARALVMLAEHRVKRRRESVGKFVVEKSVDRRPDSDARLTPAIEFVLWQIGMRCLALPAVAVPALDAGPVEGEVDEAGVPTELLTNLREGKSRLVQPDGFFDLVRRQRLQTQLDAAGFEMS